MEINSNSIKIENKIIDIDNPFYIAEIGSNHDGSLSKAKNLISAAAESGADAVKFQVFKPDDLVSTNHPDWDLVSKLSVPETWIAELKEFANSQSLVFFASPFNVDSVQILVNNNVSLLKIASSELMNTKLLLAMSRLNIPVLLSVGMSEWYEVEIALKILNSINKLNVVPLHCVSLYPTSIAQINLYNIIELKNRYGGIVGFSDHTISQDIGAWAYCLGARVFEKHFTLKKTDDGPDHGYALEPKEFLNYVTKIEDAKLSLNLNEKNYIDDENLGRHRTSLYSNNKLQKNKLIDETDFSSIRPRLGIPSNLLPYLKDLKLIKSIDENQYLKWEDLY